MDVCLFCLPVEEDGVKDREQRLLHLPGLHRQLEDVRPGVHLNLTRLSRTSHLPNIFLPFFGRNWSFSGIVFYPLLEADNSAFYLSAETVVRLSKLP